MEGFEIRPAKSGGFVVLSLAPSGYERQILFAGSLDECLGFMRNHLATEDENEVEAEGLVWSKTLNNYEMKRVKVSTANGSAE